MYKIFSDHYLLYDGYAEDLNLINPTLSEEINKSGIFTFEIYPNHIHYDKLKRLKSMITIYKENKLIFRGRMIDDVVGFYNQRQVTCEGCLSFFVDSVIRPYKWSGTIEGLLSKFVGEHNAQVDEEKRFVLGNVTVTDPNNYIVRSTVDYMTTLENINKKLVDMLGGYLIVRYASDGTYIDYLADTNALVAQDIEFSVNLLDYKLTRRGDEIFTGIIPLGAKIKKEVDVDGVINEVEERLTIKSVNDGKDFLVDKDGVEAYGTILKTMTWDDVTLPSNLKTKALEELGRGWQIGNTIELSAVDLSNAGHDVGSFELGKKIRVVSQPHGVSDCFLISKIDRSLLNPSQDRLTLGRTFKSLTEQNKSESDRIQKIVDAGGIKGDKGEDATTLRIDSSRGNLFKNNAVETVLTVSISKGTHKVLDKEQLIKVFGKNAHLEWTWKRMGEDNFHPILSTDKRIINNGFGFILSPEDVDTKIVFECVLNI